MSYAGSAYGQAPYAGASGAVGPLELERVTSSSRVGSLALAVALDRAVGRPRVGAVVFPLFLERVATAGVPADLTCVPVVRPMPPPYGDALALRRDKAFAYPTPTLVDGRIVDDAAAFPDLPHPLLGLYPSESLYPDVEVP